MNLLPIWRSLKSTDKDRAEREAAMRETIRISLQKCVVLWESISDRHVVVIVVQVLSVTWRCFDEAPCLRCKPADD